MSKTASFKKNIEDMQGHASLYKLSVPMQDYDGQEHKWVIVSTVDVMPTGTETYIFPSNKKGEIIDWLEMPFSARGVNNHDEVLSNAGYVVSR